MIPVNAGPTPARLPITYRTSTLALVLSAIILALLVVTIVSIVPKRPTGEIGLGLLFGAMLGALPVLLACKVVAGAGGLRIRNIFTARFVVWADILETHPRGSLQIVLRSGQKLSLAATAPTPWESFRGRSRAAELASVVAEHGGVESESASRIRPNWLGIGLFLAGVGFGVVCPIVHYHLASR